MEKQHNKAAKKRVHLDFLIIHFLRLTGCFHANNQIHLIWQKIALNLIKSYTHIVKTTAENLGFADAPKISKYAYGRDYHEVIKEKLNQLLLILREKIGAIHGRGFVDAAPVLERSWAQRSGLGWIGKNGNLITRQQGSFFFIATLITDLELAYDDAFARDYCGTCTKCIGACPTNAILDNKVIDGSRCISYFTIELKDMLIPNEMKDKFENWMFGCDICQDVCPWNRFSKPINETAFIPIPEILNLTTKEWESLTEESFKKIFKQSPLKRAKFKGIQRNLKFIHQEKY